MLQQPKICFVSLYAFPLLCGKGSGVGGAERQLFLFGRNLAKHGWDVKFITHTPSVDLRKSKTEFPVYPVHFGYMGGSNAQLPLAWLGLLKAMRRADADYYVLKIPAHLLPVMGAFCRVFRRKLVFWAQMDNDADPNERTDNRLALFLQDFGIRMANVVIAQTQEQQLSFKRHYGLDSSLVRSICEPLVTGAEVKNGAVVDVLWTGNSMHKKRPDVVIELARRLPEVSFAMAMNHGSNAEFDHWRRLAGQVPNIRFLGQVSPIEMEAWFGQARLLLNTSAREGFPNSFLQAWMNAIPVVSLGIDPDDLISKYDLGRIVVTQPALAIHNDQADILAGHLVPLLNSLLRDEAERLRIGKRAQKYVMENHAPEFVIPQLLCALKSNGNARE